MQRKKSADGEGRGNETVVVESKDAQTVCDSLNSSNLSDNRSGTLHAL